MTASETAHDRADRDWSSVESIAAARDLVFRYPNGKGILGVDIDVPRGCIFGVVGPSGSGKTTLVRLLLGLLTPDEGEIEVLDAHPHDADRSRIGYLPQSAVLYPDLTLRHNLDLMGSVYGMPWRSRFLPFDSARKARARIDEVLELVGLTGSQDTRFGMASGGEQRRLSLAAALVHDPDLLVLDEPTSGIDPVLRRQLWDKFEDLREEGRTLFVTTQYVGETAYCDLVGIVIEGEVLLVASPEGLRRQAYGGELLDLEGVELLRDADVERLLELDGVDGVHERLSGRLVRLLVDDADVRTPEVVEWCRQRDIEIVAVGPHEPSFDDVFVTIVEREQDRAAAEQDAAAQGDATEGDATEAGVRHEADADTDAGADPDARPDPDPDDGGDTAPDAEADAGGDTAPDAEADAGGDTAPDAEADGDTAHDGDSTASDGGAHGHEEPPDAAAGGRDAGGRA